MNEDIKWLWTIAGKNDIPKDTIYGYIEKKYQKTHITDLNKAEMDDVLAYVCDSRLVTFEKQVVRIIATAKSIPLDRESLDRMCSRFGQRRLEDLDENGLRGMMSIVTGMVEKGKKGDNSFDNQQPVQIG